MVDTAMFTKGAGIYAVIVIFLLGDREGANLITNNDPGVEFLKT